MFYAKYLEAKCLAGHFPHLDHHRVGTFTAWIERSRFGGSHQAASSSSLSWCPSESHIFLNVDCFFLIYVYCSCDVCSNARHTVLHITSSNLSDCMPRSPRHFFRGYTASPSAHTILHAGDLSSSSQDKGQILEHEYVLLGVIPLQHSQNRGLPG